TGYVCTHRCETRCTRNNYDEPVAIRALKRFAFERGKAAPSKARGAKCRVAVVGAGPSGLAAAAFLAQSGVETTVYEAKDVAGGMPALAPAFRLPPTVVQADVERIRRLGVEIKVGHRVDVRPEKLLEEGFDAVYLACGFPRDARLAIEGIDGEGIFGALEFLARVAAGERPNLGSRVLVVGGGNTAMDAARTARRLTGSPVTVLYRRTRAEMPAEEEELRDLLDEGNRIEELVSPRRVVRVDGRVVALECVRNSLGLPGPDGRRQPVAVPGSEFEIPADSVILAIGQAPDVSFLDGSVVTLRSAGAIDVDPKTGRAGVDRVYAGGDAVRGPAIIIEACADGRRAAEAICERLGHSFQPIPPVQASPARSTIVALKDARARKEARHAPERLPASRRGGFDVVEATLTEEAARREASRCLQCAVLCDKCVEVCPNRANVAYEVAALRLRLPRLSASEGGLVVSGEEPFEVRQARQILHVDDWCNECGNCTTFCVHQGKPHLEKPRLFLSEAHFALEKDNAFFIEKETIRRRERGTESRLARGRRGWTFENDELVVRLSRDFQVRGATLKRPFEGLRSLREAAEMALVLDGVSRSAPFLLV
ncbi:MAG: FAD-dependent oxidoreductase, partial [Candidatus Bipolaricaulota bacterium]|nr:FAD-dependent oxidoreductase [Candidatus Bipolaricaulota bacterium]